MSEATRRYRVRDVLGTGAFGTVYRADALGSGNFIRPVAVKILHRQLASEEPLVQRLRDEARMLAQLKHRAIVRVDDLVQMEGSWAIVMELVDGVDLQRISAYRPLPPGPAAEVIQEVASALRVAFEQQDEQGNPLRLLHRDIKPSNLALTATGEVRVLDFGIARADIPGRESQTRSVLLGTPAYMAPECFDDGPGHVADVFALGATFFELLTGHMLGRTSVDPERHEARITESMGELPVDVADHPELMALLRSMLAYREAERPTAREVERQLRDLRPTLGEPWL
ncbi:MAG: serine/threonine protein kinase, partial [Deltaproteobacteria bacterium]|nr:serine/threonine protein kinase [Deltaproteobacteria bacterium]